MPRGGKRRLLPFSERVGVGRTGSGDCVVISLHLRLFRPTRTREKGGRGERGRGGGQIVLEEGTAISLPATRVWERVARYNNGSISRLGL